MEGWAGEVLLICLCLLLRLILEAETEGQRAIESQMSPGRINTSMEWRRLVASHFLAEHSSAFPRTPEPISPNISLVVVRSFRYSHTITASLDQVYSSARELPMPDLGTLISRLLGEISEALPSSSDAELSAIADAREAEMERDPSATISHEDLLAFIHSRRK